MCPTPPAAPTPPPAIPFVCVPNGSDAEARPGSSTGPQPAANAPLPHDPLWPRAGDWPPPPSVGVAAPANLRPPASGGVVIIGVPTHKTSISPSRADTTPAAIRAALRRYSTHALAVDGTSLDLSDLAVFDAGDIPEPDAARHLAEPTETIADLAARYALVIALGGDNACTVPTALGAWGERIGRAGLVTLDAHHDLRDGVSNGSPVRRLIEAGLDGRRVVQVGIADFANSPAYTRRARDLGIAVIPRTVLDDRPLTDVAAQALGIAAGALGGGPIHVDIDVDVCDRSVAPGCPASTPGGISGQQLRTLVRALARDPRVTSFDIAEIDAAADAPDGRTVRLGALVVLEILAGFAERPVL